MDSRFEPADEPYGRGDVVHIYASDFDYEHSFGCEVVEVHCDDKPTVKLEDYSYYDVGDFSDGWITFTYLGDPDFEYHAFTEGGVCCSDVFESLTGVDDSR